MTTSTQIKAMIFGSDRPAHLFAATCAAAIVAGFDPWTGARVLAWEIFATPDMDLSENRRPKGLVTRLWVAFWLPYGHAVAHRSRFSHSLLFGTTCRVGYVALWLYLPGVISGEYSLSWLNWETLLSPAWWQNLAIAAQHHSSSMYPFWIADAVHLAKDGYRNPLHFLLGK